MHGRGKTGQPAGVPLNARSWYVCKYCKQVYTDSSAFWEHKKSQHWEELVEEKRKRQRNDPAHGSLDSSNDRQKAGGADGDRLRNKYGRFEDQRGMPGVMRRSSTDAQESGACDHNSPSIRQLALPAAVGVGGHSPNKRLSQVNNENDCRDLKLYSPQDAQQRLQDHPGKFTSQQIKRMGLGPKRLTGTMKVHYGVQVSPEQLDAACGPDPNMASLVTKGIQTRTLTQSSSCQWRPLPEDEMIGSRQTQTEKAPTAELDTQTDSCRTLSFAIQTDVPTTLVRETQTENAPTFAQGIQTENPVSKSLDTQTDMTESVSLETQTEIPKTALQESQTDLAVTLPMETQTEPGFGKEETCSQVIQTDDVFKFVLKTLLTESSSQTEEVIHNKSTRLEEDDLNDYEGDWEVETESVGLQDKATFAEMSTQTEAAVSEISSVLPKEIFVTEGLELVPMTDGTYIVLPDGQPKENSSVCSAMVLYNQFQARPPKFTPASASGSTAQGVKVAEGGKAAEGAKATTSDSKKAQKLKRRNAAKRRFLRRLFRKNASMPRLTDSRTSIPSDKVTEEDEELEDIPIVPIYSSIKFATGTWHFAKRNFWKPVPKYQNLRKRSFASGAGAPDPAPDTDAPVNSSTRSEFKKGKDEKLPHSSATVDSGGNVTLPVVQSEFGCWICPKQFTSVEDLEIHIKYVHLLFGLKLFGCSICRASYASTAALRKHIAVSHHLTGTGNQTALRKFRYFCHMCCKPVRYSNFVYHLRTQHGENSGKKGSTGKVVEESSSAGKSEKTSDQKRGGDDDRIYPCPNCEETFTVQRKLYQHRRKLHKEEAAPYQCSFCPNSYSTEKRLERHNKNIHRGKGSKIPTEATRIATQAERKCMSAETASQNSSPGSPNPSPSPKKQTAIPKTIFQCNKCKFRSPSKAGVKIHRKRAHPKVEAHPTIHDSPRSSTPMSSDTTYPQHCSLSARRCHKPDCVRHAAVVTLD